MILPEPNGPCFADPPGTLWEECMGCAVVGRQGVGGRIVVGIQNEKKKNKRSRDQETCLEETKSS